MGFEELSKDLPDLPAVGSTDPITQELIDYLKATRIVHEETLSQFKELEEKVENLEEDKEIGEDQLVFPKIEDEFGEEEDLLDLGGENPVQTLEEIRERLDGLEEIARESSFDEPKQVISLIEPSENPKDFWDETETSTAARSTTWDIEDQGTSSNEGVKIRRWRITKDVSGGPPASAAIYGFYHDETYNQAGCLVLIGAETKVTVYLP